MRDVNPRFGLVQMRSQLFSYEVHVPELVFPAVERITSHEALELYDHMASFAALRAVS